MSNKKQIKNRQVGMTMDKHTELAKVTAAMQQTKERRMYMGALLKSDLLR
ncbi:hypothetical protein P7H21_01355 [Paenibacillus larvae]|nr:hypothetical protein [Paenibacillus larvae]MDT2302958.1 hypothetical protein [Paenibacillus larvae]